MERHPRWLFSEFAGHALALSLGLILASATLVQGASVLNFPRLSFETGTLTGVAIANPTNQAASVTITAYGVDGTVLTSSGFKNPTQLSIPALQQRALLANEIFGAALSPGVVAWFQATSPVDHLTGFYLYQNPTFTFLDGADLPQTAPEILFHRIQVGSETSTELNIVNTGGLAVDLEMRLTGSGDTPLVENRTIAAKGIGRFDVQGLFGVSSVSPGAYLEVKATSVPDSSPETAQIGGFELVRGPGPEILGLNARPAAEVFNVLYFPQLAVLGPFETEVGITNHSQEPLVLSFTAYAGRWKSI